MIRPLLTIALALTLSACDDAEDSSTIDAATPDASAAVDAPSLCCPIEEPTCDCFFTGGAKENGECSAICDAEPDGWVEDVDDAGCPVLRWVGGTGSCFPFPDAGAAPP